jgi:MarR-like DNA-binding transcriptional regulator SgrR of sgrS sRNA
MSSPRYAAFKEISDNKTRIGTGPFLYQSIDASEIILKKNRYYFGKNFPEVDGIKISLCSNLPKNETINNIDVALNIPSDEVSKYDILKKEFKNSVASQHLILWLNSKKGIFSTLKYRRYFQKLIHSKIDKFIPDTFFYSPQFIFDFGIGNLKKNEYSPFIELNNTSNKFFLQKSIINIGVAPSMKNHWIFQYLNRMGIRFNKTIVSRLKLKEDSSLIEKIDAFLDNPKILSNDPEYLYYLFSKRGTMSIPMSQINDISNLVNAGRYIESTKHKTIDSFYKELNKKILSEVPGIHLGFTYTVNLFNQSSVSIDSALIPRRYFSFSNIKKKSKYL